jgi:hypothetical protein
VWQRGTANVTTAIAYTADRWQKGGATHFGVSRQVTGDTTNLPNIQYCARVQRTAGSTTVTGMDLNQSFETINSIPFVGKTVTFSFYARAGANYSASGNTLNAYIYTGTGTDQNLISSYTGAAISVSVGTTLTTTWQRFTGTATLPTTMTEMAVYFLGTPTGTAGANDYYEVTGVQLEVGSVVTPFRTNGGTIQGELAACQRYLPAILVSTGDIGSGQAYSSTAALATFAFNSTARVAPTGIVVNAAANFRLRNSTAGLVAPTAIVFGTSTLNSGTVEITGASGLSAGNATNLVNFNGGTIFFTGCEL